LPTATGNERWDDAIRRMDTGLTFMFTNKFMEVTTSTIRERIHKCIIHKLQGRARAATRQGRQGRGAVAGGGIKEGLERKEGS
jgi:hypothetical protein